MPRTTASPRTSITYRMPVRNFQNSVFVPKSSAGQGNAQIIDAAAIQNLFSAGGCVSFWIFPLSYGGGGGGLNYGTFVNKYTSPTGWFLRWHNAASLRFNLTHTTSGGEWAFPLTALRLNVWQLVVLHYDSTLTTNNPYLWVGNTGGTITYAGEASVAAAPVGTPKDDSAINLIVLNSNGNNAAADSYMTDLCLWTGAIPTLADVTAFLRNHINLPALTLKARYSNTTSGVWVDSVAANNATFTAPGVSDIFTPYTKKTSVRSLGYAIRIKSLAGKFTIVNSATLEDLFNNANGGTYVYWFKSETSTPFAPVTPPTPTMFCSPTATLQGWWTRFDLSGTYPTNRLLFGVAYTTPTSNRNYKTPTRSLTYNQWHCACISFNSNTPAINPIICLDGIDQTITMTGTGTVYVSDDTKDWNSANVASNNLVMGGEMRLISGKQWSLAEMQAYYFRGEVASGGTAVGTYLFTENAGATVADASGNGNTMTFSGIYEWTSELPNSWKSRTAIS